MLSEAGENGQMTDPKQQVQGRSLKEAVVPERSQLRSWRMVDAVRSCQPGWCEGKAAEAHGSLDKMCVLQGEGGRAEGPETGAEWSTLAKSVRARFC